MSLKKRAPGKESEGVLRSQKKRFLKVLLISEGQPQIAAQFMQSRNLKMTELWIAIEYSDYMFPGAWNPRMTSIFWIMIIRDSWEKWPYCSPGLYERIEHVCRTYCIDSYWRFLS